KPPARFQATPRTNQAIAQTIDRAQALDRSQPQAALEPYVNAARDSLHELDRNPANVEARRCYNFAVEGIFSVIRQAKLDPWTQPMRVGTNGDRNTANKYGGRARQQPAGLAGGAGFAGAAGNRPGGGGAGNIGAGNRPGGGAGAGNRPGSGTRTG